MSEMSIPPITDDPRDLRSRIADWRRAGERIALVPTMGALHAGHLALVEEAAKHGERVVVSIFVNPTQFAPHEDFDQYPRDLEGDAAKLGTMGVDLIYAPTIDAMYPTGHQTTVSVKGLSQPMEGAHRPHFFDGVTTIVSKLFIQVAPDVAVFGQKDYQQLLVIGQMTRDLDLPVEVIGLPTVRETDGLALSSRNAYLSEDERRIAVELSRTLIGISDRLAGGAAFGELGEAAKARLETLGFDAPDYLDFRDAETLQPIERADRPGRLLVAARLGKTRLIDNMPVPVAV